LPFVLDKSVGKALIYVEDLVRQSYQSRQHKRYIFEGALRIGGTCFHAYKTSDQIGHTCMGPQKPKWPGAPHFLNPSLIGKTNAELDQNEKINAVVETQQTN